MFSEYTKFFQLWIERNRGEKKGKPDGGNLAKNPFFFGERGCSCFQIYQVQLGLLIPVFLFIFGGGGMLI